MVFTPPPQPHDSTHRGRQTLRAQNLFENLDWLVTPNDRIGLVGANGTGKSTLLKVLAGLDSLDGGSLTVQKGISIGYLPQEGLSLSGRTVFAECLTRLRRICALEQEQEDLTRRMARTGPRRRPSTPRWPTASTAWTASSARATATPSRPRWAACSPAWASRSAIGSRRTEEFSGGWQMRIALAKLLLEKPNLLLLDEPTNHLDLEARNWLEDYLSAYPHAFVLVSHDRYFLDVTVRKRRWSCGTRACISTPAATRATSS